jgi:hypothetical protein
MTLLAAALAAALAVAPPGSPATAGAAAAAALPFVSDDYGRALAEARTRGVPLVVDAWAPW